MSVRSWSRRAAVLLDDLGSWLSFAAANLPARWGAYSCRRDVAFGPDPRQRLDVYVPRNEPADPRPVIVFWHGGRWSHGDKRDYRFVGAALASLGCVVVVPNYRLYPQVRMPDLLVDAALAASWAGAYAREFHDPARLILMGHSAGAMLAALVTLDARHFAAAERDRPPIAGVIGLSGPYDFLPLVEPDLIEIFGPPSAYPDSQAINFVHAGAPPMLLVHGAADEDVWPKNSRNLAAALESRGVPVCLRLYPRLRHADTVAALALPARGRAPLMHDIASFVDGLRSDSRAQAP